jgi:hypothetical protein
VRYDERQPGRRDSLPEGLRIRRVDRGDIPAIDVTGKHLQALTACFNGPLHGPAQASRNRLMGAHRPSRTPASRSGCLAKGFFSGIPGWFWLHADLLERWGGFFCRTGRQSTFFWRFEATVAVVEGCNCRSRRQSVLTGRSGAVHFDLTTVNEQ